PRAAAFVNSTYVDLHATDAALPPSVRQLLAADLLDQAQQAALSPHAVKLAPDAVTLLAPVPDPQKIVCLGLNYRDHAAESGSPIPRDPVLFSKYPTALIGHGAAIHLPRVSQEVDYEAELVIIVGKRGRHVRDA